MERSALGTDADCESHRDPARSRLLHADQWRDAVSFEVLALRVSKPDEAEVVCTLPGTQGVAPLGGGRDRSW